MAYKFAFVMDRLEAVMPDKDTTFVFMLEALRRGHEVYHLGLRGLHTHGHRAFAAARRCEVARITASSITARSIRWKPSTRSSCARIRPPTRPTCTPR